jgi:hypothetical protein
MADYAGNDDDHPGDCSTRRRISREVMSRALGVHGPGLADFIDRHFVETGS